MELLQAQKFSFTSMALPSDTFGVVNFQGTEGLSQCYRFEIQLVTTRDDVDLGEVLQKPAVFTILREDGDIPFHGILAEFEMRQAFDKYIFYRAVLAPKFWWLQLTHHNQVFLDMNLPSIIEAVLKDGGLTVVDFDLRLRRDYPVWEYICQYGESHFQFVSRWMERMGIYYFFEQTPRGENLVLTDTALSHTHMPEGKTIYYAPPSGLDEKRREEVIQSIFCRQVMLPRKVILKDYNYRTPSLDLLGEAEVIPKGRGEVFIYGDHFRTPEEGDALAKIRAEELRCREKQFPGESTIPYLRPGYVFDLEDHFRADHNQPYLVTELFHRGSQTAYLISGIQRGLSETEEKPYYQNSFTAIPKSVQFRPTRTTSPAKFYGTINARIDASGSGKYAELDEQGRYKVILPFDLSGRKGGKASTYLRMAQPYAGTDHGMHFPLHKDTEVLLTFIDGDPDRPIVAGAVPNPLTPSPLHSSNQTMAHITTGGQNKIHFEDMAGTQRILMQTPTANSWIRVGAPNDPPPQTLSDTGLAATEGNGIRINTAGDLLEDVEGKKQIDLTGNYISNVGGTYTLAATGKQTETVGPANGPATNLMKETKVIGKKTEETTGDHTEKVLGAQTVDVTGLQTVKAGSRSLQVAGNFTETIGGAWTSTVKGMTTVSYESDTSFNFNGDKYENNQEANTWHSGATFEGFAGEQLEIFIGAKQELNLGAFFEFKLAYEIALVFAISMEFYFGGKIETHVGFKIEKEAAEVHLSTLSVGKKIISVLTGGLIFHG